MDSIHKEIINSIKENSSQKQKENAERYFKGVIPFYGLKNPEANQIAKAIYRKYKLPKEEVFGLAEDLFKSKYFEEKQIAIILLSLVKKQLNKNDLGKIKEFVERYVNNWAHCDVLSGKVVTEIIKKDISAADEVVKWKDSENIWLKRAAAISFVKLGHEGRYSDYIIKICDTILNSKERFVQLGVGWVLREAWLGENKRISDFITKNKKRFSREALRYATEKFDKEKRDFYLKNE